MTDPARSHDAQSEYAAEAARRVARYDAVKVVENTDDYPWPFSAFSYERDINNDLVQVASGDGDSADEARAHLR